MISLIMILLITVVLAFLVGKLVSKVKLPAILGWLIAGMLLGPHAFSLINQEILDAGWYQISVHVLECAVGLMIGTNLFGIRLKIGKSDYYNDINAVVRYFPCSVACFWNCFLSYRRSVIFNFYFRWNCIGDSACTCIIHCPGI